MVQNDYDTGNAASNSAAIANDGLKPTYALEHLATMTLKNESERKQPKEKIKMLKELDKNGSIWPVEMYMIFNGQWIVMLDNNMQEIEIFPGSLIADPTAFISTDPLETCNNLLVFSVPGASLGKTEMHIFQVKNVSAVDLVEDLEQLSRGIPVTIDRNATPLQMPRPERPHQTPKDQYGIIAAAASVGAEKSAHDREQTERDIFVLNHCFEDIERFVARLHYAAQALEELKLRKKEHNPHGEGLLVIRARPPTESEFHDIFAKIKLGLNYLVRLQHHLSNAAVDPVHSTFISLNTIRTVCNDVYISANISEKVVNPLLRRETIEFLNGCLEPKDKELWQSLGSNWCIPKDQFKDHKGSYHPIFYDEWSPDWIVDEEVPYLPSTNKSSTPQSPGANANSIWLTRLQSRNVKIAEVAYNKTANNDKELNVTKGEYLEIINDSRNWWKARNSAGNIGYVPHTVLTPYNFEIETGNQNGHDTLSITSSVLDNDHQVNVNPQRNTLVPLVPVADRESMQPISATKNMSRSYSMPPIVPVPPPMPPANESQQTTPSGTLNRNMAAAGTLAAMRARNECDADNAALLLQDTVNDELRYTLQQRQQRRDLEILKTPEIFINQKSTPKEVEEWLRGKGFSDNIVKRLHVLSGEEIFALSPHTIEGYFGQKESRRLISQIVLQKNICEYKTIRSSELSAKLARARQKADQPINDPNEVF